MADLVPANRSAAAALHPAQIFRTTLDAAAAADLATAALRAEGFRARSRPGALPVVLEFGSASGEFFFGPLFGLLPGSLGKHAFAVVLAEDQALTMSLVRGTRARDRVDRAIAAARGQLIEKGLLLSESEPIASDDLPAESPASPRGFRRARRELIG